MKTVLPVNLPNHEYNIYIEKNILQKVGTLANLNRRVLIVTDDGVPQIYAETVQKQCQEAYIKVLPQGEGSKSLAALERLLAVMLKEGFSRHDLVIAVGGGVMGDLAGFAAAVYMRGIDFINIPTTTLSQIDSSIGGKTAVNLNGVKNIVGAFHQPKAVFIDPETLQTLPERHYLNGLAEAVKAGMIADAELFRIFESLSLSEIKEHIENIILQAVKVKKYVVEQDEKEAGFRKTLNFGHTLGHGIESLYGLSEIYHGEAVAVGMMMITENTEIKERLAKVLKKLGLPTAVQYDKERIMEAVCHDKKSDADSIDLILVNEIGKAVIQKTPLAEIGRYM